MNTAPFAVALALFAAAPPSSMVTWDQISSQPRPPAGQRIEYGADPLQFGVLRLPEGHGPFPVAVVIHGGCWQAEYDLGHIEPVSAALTSAGVATWTIEYRRIGNAGGGWPGTLDDAARATDFLRSLAQRFPLDLDRVVLAGHSAGGQLALWLAARHNLPHSSVLFAEHPLVVRGVVALAGISNLRDYGAHAGSCNSSVAPLLGGTPSEVADRYAQASPVELLPLGVASRLVHGEDDPTVPIAQSREFERLARAKGDDARVVAIPGAGHFNVVAPFAPAWAEVEKAVLALLAPR